MKRFLFSLVALLIFSGTLFSQNVQTVGEPADTLRQAHVTIDSTLNFRSKPITPLLVSLSSNGKVTSASMGDTSLATAALKDAAVTYAKLAQALKDTLAQKGLPAQSGNSGKYLTTDGTVASWATVSGGGGADADSVVGNEIANVTDATLTRSGSGTNVSPYTVGLNLSRANTWTARQVFPSAVADSGKFVYVRINNAYTMPTAVGTSGQFLAYNGAWATPTTSNITEGTKLFYTDARARAAVSSSATGLTYTSSTGVFSFTTGYSIPTTANQTNWGTAYTDRMKWDGGSTGLVAATGRASLELGGAAVLNVGATAGTVAAGNHAHSGTYEPVITTLGLTKGGANATSYTASQLLRMNSGGTAFESAGVTTASFATSSHVHTGTYEPANANIQSHITNTSNPHSVTSTQVLPSQTGNSGKVLGTNGTSASWVAASSGTGDIEGVNVTAPVTGGGSSGTVTVGVDTTEDVKSLATKGWVQRQGYGVGGGDITSVGSGDGLGGGAIAGDVTLVVNISANGGLQTSNDSLRIKLNGSTLTKSSLGLKVADNTFAAYSHSHSGVYEPVFSTLGIAKGGTNATSYTASQLLRVNSAGTAFESAGVTTSSFAIAAAGVTNGNSHDHNGGDGGQIAYANLSGLPSLGTIASQAANSVSITGGAISATAITLVQSAAPAPTAEGVVQWDTDDDKLKIGDGSATETISSDASNASTYLGISATAASASKWAAARSLAGNSVDGSANVPFANKFIVQGTVDAGLTGAQFLGALGTGIVKNTTSTGVLSIAVAGTDYLAPTGSAASLTSFPTLNQNTTGTAAGWTTARSLAGNSVNGTADVPFTNKFIVQGTADAGLTGAQFLGALGTGLLKNTTTSGVISVATAGTDYLAPTLTSGRIFVGNASNAATGVAVSGDVTITNAGVVALVANAADSTNLADGSVTSETIRDAQVKTVDIAANAVDSTKIANGAVTSETIRDGQVKLADLQAQTSANWATKVSDETGTGVAVFGTSPTITGANLGVVSASTISGQIQHLRFTLVAPNALVTAVGSPYNIPIWVSVDSAITVTRIKVTCNADPTTELTGDLKWADAFIGLAGATLINDFDTASGVRDDNTITLASVAAGKCLYVVFDAVPESALKTIAFDVMYYYQ